MSLNGEVSYSCVTYMLFFFQRYEKSFFSLEQLSNTHESEKLKKSRI